MLSWLLRDCLGTDVAQVELGQMDSRCILGLKPEFSIGATKAIREDSPISASLGPGEEEIAGTQEKPSLPTPRASV